MTEEELKVGNTYIIKENNTNKPIVTKIKVLELTNTTVYNLYIDSGGKYRELLTEFQYKYKVIEDLGNILEEQFVKSFKEMKDQPIYFAPFCKNKQCFCDGSCYKHQTYIPNFSDIANSHKNLNKRKYDRT